MSGRTIIDCEACRDALTELVCDELDTETRNVVLAHTQTCAGCAAELVKLRAVLQVAESMPLEAPSPRVHAAVMLAAREANVRRAALAQAPHGTNESPFEVVRRWLTRLGTWAMSPQVAMASVLLLMLGVGLVALPLGQDREQTALRAAHEAEEAKPATASGTALVPAAPAADNEADAPARSAASADKAMQNELRLQAKGGTQAKPAAKRREAARAAGKSLATKDEAAVDDKLESASRRAPSGSGTLRGIGTQGAGGASANRSKQAFPGSAERESAQDSPAEAPAAFAGAPPPKPAAAAPSPAQESSDYALSAKPEPKKSDSAPESQLLAQGIAAARSGDHAGAIAVLRPLADQGPAKVRREASLWLARSYRATDNCAAALPLYAPLVQPPSASPALLSEAIACYERTGDVQAAAVLRSRLQTMKATQTDSAKPALKN